MGGQVGGLIAMQVISYEANLGSRQLRPRGVQASFYGPGVSTGALRVSDGQE